MLSLAKSTGNMTENYPSGFMFLLVCLVVVEEINYAFGVNNILLNIFMSKR